LLRKILKKEKGEALPLSNEQLMDALYRAKRLLESDTYAATF
jgi:hypothetical protein